MKKTKTPFKNLALIAAGLVALIIFYNQDVQMQLLTGIYALILYLAYLGKQQIDQLKKERFYNCTFEKEIIAADSDKVITNFRIEYKLPFPPYIGLEAAGHLNPMPEDCYDYDNHDFQSFYTGKITNVIWYYSRFDCKVEPYKMETGTTIEEVIVAHCEEAWQLNRLYLIPGLGRGKESLFSFIDETLSKLKTQEGEASQNQYVRLERVKNKLEGR